MRSTRHGRLLRTISNESGNHVGVAMACGANLVFLLLLAVPGSSSLRFVADACPVATKEPYQRTHTHVVVNPSTPTPIRLEGRSDRNCLRGGTGDRSVHHVS